VSDFYVGGIQTLSEAKGWVNEAEARDLLERAATATLPLMAKRGWKVELLKEFFPKNPGLLGLNAGFGRGTSDHRCTVSVRCRPAHAGKRGGCYAYRDIIGTLVHELTHIVHGAHDAKFYALMDELLDEVDGVGSGFNAILDRARAGSPATSGAYPAAAGGPGASARGTVPFQGTARTTGGAVPPRARSTGGAVPRGLTPAEAAARAAERRLRDQGTCGQGHAQDEVIDLTAEEAEEEAASLSQSSRAAAASPRRSPRRAKAFPGPPSRPPEAKRQRTERRRRTDGVGTYLAHVPKAGDAVVDLTADDDQRDEEQV